MEMNRSSAKQLTRARHGKILCGVAQGVANYFAIDPLLVRIIFIALFFLHGVGLLLYFILCVILPSPPYTLLTNAPTTEGASGEYATSAPHPSPQPPSRHAPQSDASIWVMGVMLIILGFLFLANNLFPDFNLSLHWPWILIAVGIGILLSVYLNTPPSSADKQENE